MKAPFCTLANAWDANRYGGKAAGLHWLSTQLCRSVPGFVISADALCAHLHDQQMQSALSELEKARETKRTETLAELCETIQQLIKATTLSPSFKVKLKSALSEVVFTTNRFTWVVRSSAVGEDGIDHSFAGQFESVLNVTGYQALEQAILRVWASTYNLSATQYALHRNAPITKMAVIVQPQIPAVCAGVLFTHDPMMHSDEFMRVEYCEGLADTLVSGRITPTSVSLPRTPQSTNNDCTAQRDVEVSELDQLFLPIRDELISTSLQLENAAEGKPLDIEWAVDDRKRLYLVQCRPITTCHSTLLQHWTNANIGENYPGPVVPLLASFVPRGYAAYFKGLGQTLGVSSDRIASHEDALQGLVGLQAGRLYYNLSQIVTVLHAIPGGAWLAKSFNAFTGTQGSPKPSTKSYSYTSQFCQALSITLKLPGIVWRIKSGVTQFESLVDAYAQKSTPSILTTLKSNELADLLQEFLTIRLQRWTPAALADAAAMVSYNALQQLLNRWLPDSDQSQLQNALLQGLPDIITTAPVEHLWDLALIAKQNPSLVTLLQNNSPALIWQRLPIEQPLFHSDLMQYLQTWGFRYSGELMLTQPTPTENPLPIIQLLQTYIADKGNGPIDRSAQSAQSRIQSTHEIAQKLTPSKRVRSLPLPSRARIFHAVLKATQASICLRERARMKQALLYTRLRHVSLALGERLVQQHSLSDQESIFFLTIDEAIDLGNRFQFSTQGAETEKIIVQQRRAEFKRCEPLNPPEQMQLPVGTAWSEEKTKNGISEPNSSELTGLGACSGTTTGRASVILNVADIQQVESDTVLVTRQTDPGWAPVFFLIKGLVVERGGMLSHGAIIAREYGIPAVVGVADATTRIQCGDHLLVDGNQGRVAWAE